jgi:hypothetical protein
MFTNYDLCCQHDHKKCQHAVVTLRPFPLKEQSLHEKVLAVLETDEAAFNPVEGPPVFTLRRPADDPSDCAN